MESGLVFTLLGGGGTTYDCDLPFERLMAEMNQAGSWKQVILVAVSSLLPTPNREATGTAAEHWIPSSVVRCTAVN